MNSVLCSLGIHSWLGDQNSFNIQIIQNSDDQQRVNSNSRPLGFTRPLSRDWLEQIPFPGTRDLSGTLGPSAGTPPWKHQLSQGSSKIEVKISPSIRPVPRSLCRGPLSRDPLGGANCGKAASKIEAKISPSTRPVAPNLCRQTPCRDPLGRATSPKRAQKSK